MKRLTKRQMRIFAVGQLGWSTLSGIISAWFVTFYLPTQNDIAGGAIQYIMPGLIIGGFLTVLGLITALSRVFDAVTDPLSAAFYPIVPKLVKKFGKKKLVITGFLGLALAYVIAGSIGVIGVTVIPGIVYGVLICVIAAFPMALPGIIPQSIVAASSV